MIYRYCTMCFKRKPKHQFYKAKHIKSGMSSRCVLCTRLVLKEYRNTLAWKISKKKAYQKAKRLGKLRGSSKYYRNPKHYLKILARQAVSRALLRRDIKRPRKCEFAYKSKCEGRLEAHHEDYSKQLEIMWLCKKHHEQKDHQLANQRNLTPLNQ